MFQGEEEDVKKVSLIEIVKKNKPEWKYLVLGIFGASLFGLYPALYGLSLGGIFGVRTIEKIRQIFYE